MNDAVKPAGSRSEVSWPPLRPVARKEEPWTVVQPGDVRGGLWFWWEKVRSELEAREISVKQLADAAEIPYRSLHRWLHESTPEEMRDRGPKGEVSVVARIAYALGWTWWYALGVAWQWPPSEGTRRFMAAWERLIDKQRIDVLDPVAHAMATCCEMAIEAVEANETTRAQMQLKLLEVLGESEGSA